MVVRLNQTSKNRQWLHLFRVKVSFNLQNRSNFSDVRVSLHPKLVDGGPSWTNMR